MEAGDLDVFLLGGRGGGGEEVFLRELQKHPPQSVRYRAVMEPHESTDDVRALRIRAAAFNRLVHPFLWPLPGLRAYRVGPSVDLVHVHNHTHWLRLANDCPVVLSVGGGTYPHYLETYLGWSRNQIRRRYASARRIYRPLGIRDAVATPETLDAIVVLSPFAARQLEEVGVPREKVHAIPPGFALPDPVLSPVDDRPFTFLLVGRDPHRKGVDLAIQAAKELRERGHTLRLRLIGDPSYPELTVPGLIEGVERVPRHRLLAEVFPAADAVLVPSRAEGFGFTAVEGMGRGLPVIASDRDALPWIVGDGGLLCEPEDVRSLLQAMECLIEDRDRARALGEEGRRRFEAEFTIDRFRNRLGRLYRCLLGETTG